MKYISEHSKNKLSNNFNLLRMISALCVIISHSYSLAYVNKDTEPLGHYLPNYSLGSLSVWTFFIISGYFISQSFERNNFIDFIIARVSRIYPGLLVVLLIATFVVGPIYTVYPPSIYFNAPSTYTYIVNALSLYKWTDRLPGIFANNPFPNAVNGSLWTLYYEVLCYAMIVAVGFATRRSNWLFGLFFISYLVGQIVLVLHNAKTGHYYADHFFIDRMHVLTYPFVLEMAYYRFRDFVPYKGSLALAAIVAIIVLHPSSPTSPLHYMGYFIPLWSYLVIYCGFYPSKFLHGYNKIGDYSYGVYIYGWLVQQMLVASFMPITPMVLILSAVPISIIMGALSWHFIEGPALNHMKPLITRFIRQINPFAGSAIPAPR